MTPDDPEDGDDVLARLRAARPDRDTPDLADRACMARLHRLKGPAQEVSVGGYVIEQEVGEGAYGKVYRARHPRVEKLVALKHLHRDVAQQIGSAARSLREANSLGKLNHPNVVQVFDVVEDGDETYIAMEYVDGESLVRWQQEPRAWQEVLSVYLQAGDGLAAAHAAGLLHLDLKPANVLVGRDGRVRVVDFGLARHVAGPTSVGDDKASETLVEHVPARGTIPYSSPEQRISDDVDARSDQFSFCVALYEALHGELPFTASELAEMRYVAFERPTSGARGRIPRRIDNALRRGLSRDVSARWPNMAVLLASLRSPAWFQRPFTWAFAGATLVAVPAAFAYPTNGPQCADPREQLAGAWDDDRKARVARAFESSAAPYAARVGLMAERRLDSYADEWITEMTSACATVSASAVETSQRQARIACLLRARDRLSRVSAMLVDSTPEVLEHTDDLLHELAPTRSCDRTDTNETERVSDDARESLAVVDRSRLWLATGRIGDARSAAELAVASAEATGDAGAKAEAHLVRGEVYSAAGETAPAVVDFEAAAGLAISAERDDVSARAWLALARLAALDLQDAAKAEAWLRLAEATSIRLNRPPLLAADVHDARGVLESLRGDEHAAELSHRAALEELDGEIEEDDPRWTYTWMSLARARLRDGDLATAEAFDRKTLELRQRRLGDSHPDVARAHLGLAVVLHTRGDIRTALQEVERALAIQGSNYGELSIKVAPPLTLQAQLLLELDDVDAAERSAMRAWALQREHLPMTHVERKEGALGLLIEIADRRKDYARVLDLYREARAEAEGREDHLGVAAIDLNVAWTLCELDRCNEAAPMYTALRTHPSHDALILAYAAAGLGRVELAAGRARAAVPHLETALSETLQLSGSHEAELAEIRWLLARALIATNAFERGVKIATQALAYYEHQGNDREKAALRQLIHNSTHRTSSE